MYKIEIEILEPITNDIIGLLDLEKAGDFPLKLTKEVASITNIVARRGTYSLDFNLPDTPNNRRLLFGVGFVPAISSSLNILQKKNARIKVNNTELERGFIRFNQGQYEGQYRGTFYGGNNEWTDQLQNIYLNDLDYSNLGEIQAGFEEFNGTRIDVVNSGDSDNYDLAYPYIDRNTGSAASQLRPVLYIKKVIERMFDKIGYSVSSNFINSTFIKGDGAEYKGVVLDPAVTFDTDPDTIEALRVEIGSNRIADSTDSDTWNTDYFIGNLSDYTTPNIRDTYSFPEYFNVEAVDLPDAWNPSTGLFTAPQSGSYNIMVEIPNQQYSWATQNQFSPPGRPWVPGRNLGISAGGFGPFTSPLRLPPKVRGFVVKNNVGTSLINGTVLYVSSPGNFVMDNLINFDANLSSGDTLSVFFTMDYYATPSNLVDSTAPNPNINFWRWHPGEQAEIKIQPTPALTLGDIYEVKAYMPNTFTCLDLLQDFKFMFNLYFDVDINRKVVTIETRDEYYLPLSQAKDITQIIDLDRVKIDRKTPYKKELSFKYIDDSKDGYLSKLNKIMERTYAEYTHLLSDRFEAGEVVYSTKVIAPTAQNKINPSNIVTSTILPNYNAAENVGKGITKEYAPRVYQLIRNQQFDAVGNPYRNASPLVVSSAMMEEFGNVATIDDKRLTFNGANGLVDQFYAKTLSNIEGSAVVSLKVKISLWQFKNWNMRQPVYISEPAQLKGYYIVEAIENFSVGNEELANFRLLTYKDWQAATISTGGTNASLPVTTVTGGANNPSPILVEVNGVIVNCLDNNFNTMFKI